MNEQRSIGMKLAWHEGRRRPRHEWSATYDWMKRELNLDPADVDDLRVGKLRELLEEEL